MKNGTEMKKLRVFDNMDETFIKQIEAISIKVHVIQYNIIKYNIYIYIYNQLGSIFY